MNRYVWAFLSVCLLLLNVSAIPALAQQPAADAQTEALEDVQLTRAVIAAERQAIITKAMDLTPDEMQGFWPLYRDYRVEVGRMGDRMVALIAAYADAYDNLTNETADKLLTEFVGIEKERARIKAKYLPKFKKVIPAKKVVRFYQLENKLDLVILSELAETIPLAR